MKKLFTIFSILLIFNRLAGGNGAENKAPIVKIRGPANGARFRAGETITFRGTARDLEDGEMSGKSLVWTSDLDHYIGEGNSFSCRLSRGFHIIILTARDSGKLEARDSVFITVDGEPKPPVREPEPEKKAEPAGEASIEFSYVPPYGSSRNLMGRVLDADPTKYGVAVFIMMDGTWWTKPYWATPLTKVNSDGTWICDITTGGVDEIATRIVSFLVLAGYEPPLASGNYQLPDALEENSLARVEARRSRSGEVTVIGKKPEKKAEVRRLKGVCYGPFRDNQNPDMGVFPSLEEIEADFGLIPQVALAVRTYGSTNTPGDIPSLCEKAGVECYPGAWIGRYKTENEKEIEVLLNISKQGLGCVKGLIVGNEVLLAKEMSEEEFTSYIRRVKESTLLPVTTAEVWSVWREHPELFAEVDFLTVHIHPYWEGVPVGEAAEHVLKVWKYMNTLFSGKRIVIGETGWPSKGKTIGKAVPSPENQARFFKEFTELAERESIEYFWFELFDEKWKDKFEGKAGAYWGIYNSDGSLKKEMKGLVPAGAKGISRPPTCFSTKPDGPLRE